MATIQDISEELGKGNVKFHKREESDLFRDVVDAFLNKHFVTSANLCATLYEKIFTTRLVNETANPPGFKPSKDNLHEQLRNLLNREVEIIEKQKLSFRQITKQLVESGVLTEVEKEECDTFYSTVRNPVVHGLTLRLFELTVGHPPAHTFEIDANYETVFEKNAESLIKKVYDLMTVKVLRKR